MTPQKIFNSNLFALLFVASAIIGYVTIELRLHQEYQDYREHQYYECSDCRSLACSISSGEYKYVEWLSDDCCCIAPPPAWSRVVLYHLNSWLLYNANANCKHRWREQLIGDRLVHEKSSIYFMPLKLLQIQKLASWFFYILCLLILICLTHLFVTRNNKRNLIFITFWSLIASLVVIFPSIFPVGIPLTEFLREYRVLSRRLTESSSAMGTRAEYLLSDEVIIEMAKASIEIVPRKINGGKYSYSPEIRDRDHTFPFKCFKRAQARLAIAVAQYDAEMAGRFFYGSDFTADDNLTNLTARLAKRLVKVDNASFVMEKPCIKKTIIRGEGIVDVLWAGDRAPRALFQTTYKVFHQNNKRIWIPIRNVSDGVYRSSILVEDQDNVVIW